MIFAAFQANRMKTQPDRAEYNIRGSFTHLKLKDGLGS